MKHVNLKRALVLLIAISLVCQLAGCSIVDKISALTAKSTDQNAVVSGFLSQDGSCWFPMQNDEHAVHISGNVKNAYLSPDRETIVVLETDGILYWTTPADPAKKTTVTETADSIFALRNDGVLYTVSSSGTLPNYRYDFETGASIKLGTGNLAVADDTTSALICDDEGIVWMLPAGKTTPERIGQYDGTLQACGVDNAGVLGVWSVVGSDEQTVYLCDAGEREKLETVDNDYTSTYAYFSRDNSVLVVVNTGAGNVFLKHAGEDTVRVELPNDIDYSDPYTANDSLRADSNVDAKSSIYIGVEDDDNSDLSNIYWINFSGERERILSAVQSYLIKDGVVYYTDEDNNLSCAALDGSRVSGERKISGNVGTTRTSPTSGDVVYSKNIGEDSIGSLYYYSYQKDLSSRITASAPFYCFRWDNEILFSYDFSGFSADGKYIYYLDNGTVIEDSFGAYGTLCRYKISDGSVEQLSATTMGFFDSGLLNGLIDPNFLWCEQFLSHDDDQYITDLFVLVRDQKIPIAQGIVS